MYTPRPRPYSTWSLTALAVLFLLAGRSAFTAGGLTQTWIHRFNGAANSNDYGKASALDGAGGLFVIAQSDGVGTGADYSTTKYNTATGAVLWTATYDGPGHSTDEPTALAVDAAGNVLVTGASIGAGSNYDFATVKYDGATGAQLWEARYNGTGNGSDSSNAIVLDGAGNAMVTGNSLGSNTDVATVKYNGADGTQSWASRYNGPSNLIDGSRVMTVDGSGNPIIAGGTYQTGTGGINLLVVKYAGGNGAQLWASTYNGPGNDDDLALAISSDGGGNPVVTGFTYAAASAQNILTIKYDGGNGSMLWLNNTNGPANGNDAGSGVVVNPAGDIFVSAYVNTGSARNIATYRLSGGNGAQTWVSYYNGPANGVDVQDAHTPTLDPAGNVVVTGYSQGVGTGYDFVTLAYAAATGAELWALRYDGPVSGDENGRSVQVDASGAVYVTGSSPGSGSGSDAVTLKYSIPPTAQNVTGSCQVTRGGLRKNIRTGRWTQTASVKNMSIASIPGPIALVLDGLSANATLFNKTGDTLCAVPAGSPYRDSAGSLAPGATANFTLEFTNPTNAAIAWTPRVLDGTGLR